MKTIALVIFALLAFQNVQAQSHLSQSVSNSTNAITQATVQSSVASIRLAGSNFDASTVALDLVLDALKEMLSETSNMPQATSNDLKLLYKTLKPISPQMSVQGTSAASRSTTDATAESSKGSSEYSSEITDQGATKGSQELASDSGEFSAALGGLSVGASYMAYDILLAEQVEAAKEEIIDVFKAVSQGAQSSSQGVQRGLKAAYQRSKDIVLYSARTPTSSSQSSSNAVRGSTGVTRAAPEASSIVKDASEHIGSESSEGSSAVFIASYVNPVLDGSGTTESGAMTLISSSNITGEINVSIEDIGAVSSERYRKMLVDSAQLELMEEIDMKSDQDINQLMKDPMVVEKALRVQEAYDVAIDPRHIILQSLLEL